MRLVIIVLTLFCATPAWSGLLEDAKQSYVEAFADLIPVNPGDSKEAARLHRDFEELLTAAQVQNVRLVVATQMLGQSFPSRVITVHEEVGSLSKAKRMFILAHELGHIVNKDFDKYFNFVETAERALSFSAGKSQDSQYKEEFSRLSHTTEFGADEFASRLLVKLGLDVMEGAEVLSLISAEPDSATHPATTARLSRMKAFAR